MGTGHRCQSQDQDKMPGHLLPPWQNLWGSKGCLFIGPSLPTSRLQPRASALLQAPRPQPHAEAGQHRVAPHRAHSCGQELLHRAGLLLTAQH